VADTLKEYVVSLGWKVDEAGFKRFQETLGAISKGAISVAKNFAEVGGALVATAKVADATFQKFAAPMENLYFAAQRLGSGPGQIKAFGAALEAVGIGADETNAALLNFQQLSEQLGQANKGKGLLNIDPRIQGNNTLSFYQGLQNIAARDNGTAASHASAMYTAQTLLGVSQDFYDRFKLHEKEIPGFVKRAADIVGKSNLDASTGNTHQAEIERIFAGLKGELAGDDLAGQEAGKMKELYNRTGQLVDQFSALNKATGGLLGEVAVAGGLLGTFLTTLGGLKFAGRLLAGSAGRAAVGKSVGEIAASAASGAATVAETEAAAAAAARATALRVLGGETVAAETAAAIAGGGSGLLAIAASLIGPIVAAVAGSELLKSATRGTWWGSDEEAAPGQGYGLKDQFAWLKGKADYVSKSLTDFVAGFEGHAKNGYGVYNDIGGHATAGYGHLVRPGENLDGLDKQGAMALLGQDLAGALAEVKRSVHVALTGNQTKALADFVFNLGAGNFEKSSLLKELNAGHYEAAAARFQDYNKVLQNGHYVVNDALARRRATEAATFRTPDSKTVNLDVTNHFTVNGSKDPQATADAVASRQARINNDLVRNTQPAVV
jgi:lysozyme